MSETLNHREVQVENIRLALTAVVDTVEDIRRQLDKLMEPEANGESLVCEKCDAGMDLSLAEALKEGWENLQFTPDLPMANFCGTCKSCLDEEDKEAERQRSASAKTPTPKTPGHLFDTFPTDD